MTVEKKDSFGLLAEQRQSTRRYDSRPVDREKIIECVEAARIAPSACNSQPWHFIVVEDEKQRSLIASYCESRVLKMNLFVKQAPIIIVAVTEHSNRQARIGGLLKRKSYNVIDLSIAVEHLCLQATSLGLGSCILGWFNERKIKRLLKIPFGKRVHLIITLGYPAEGNKVHKKVRKPLGDILSFEFYRSQENTK